MGRTGTLKTPYLCYIVLGLWAASAVSMSVFYSSPTAHMLLRSKRANGFLEELKPPSLERECMEEFCNFEEAREIHQTREATLEFWTVYSDGNQCIPNACQNGFCVDQVKSFICQCNPGFEGKYCDTPSTYNNCSVENGGCEHDCHEKKKNVGRYCSCVNGYKLHDDSKQCSPINQQSCGQILIAKSAYNSNSKSLTPWLVGGEVGKKGDSPWQVVVLSPRGSFHCGGVLIDESWVLTAAHCLEGFTRVSVRLGDYKLYSKEVSEVTLPVSSIVTHPDYNRKTVNNDIALLRLASPVKFSTYIVPACLPSRELAERVLHLNGTMTVVTGWGMEEEGVNKYSSELKHINIPLVEHNVCASYMSNNVTENMLCAGTIGIAMDACKGDSGGPMMIMFHKTWFLVGLVSWGEGCGHKDKLGVYTKVSNYMEWISNVQKDPPAL